MANRKTEIVKFNAQMNKALTKVGSAVKDVVCTTLDVADSKATLAKVSAGLVAAMQQAIDVAKASKVVFTTIVQDGKKVANPKCPTRAAFWATIDAASCGMLEKSSYVSKVKSSVNAVLAGLSSDIKDYNDKAAKRGKYAPKVAAPADAKPATTVASEPAQPNAVLSSVDATWHYLSTAPAHMAMMRAVFAKVTENEAMSMDAAIQAVIKERAAALKAVKGSK